MLVGNGITVGSYVKAQYLCCDLLLKGGSGLVLEIAGGILSREVRRGTGGLLGLRGIGVSFFMAPFVFFRGLTGVGDVIHFGGGILLVA